MFQTSISLRVSAITLGALFAPTLAAQHSAHLMYELKGESTTGHYGAALANAGDVDKDGCDDIVCGARFNSANGTRAGAVFVHSGTDGRLLWSAYGNPSDTLGASVDGAGDVNRDGYDDVIAGGSAANSSTGRAVVYSGKDGKVLWSWSGAATGDFYGVCVAGAGDVNLDGHADLIVGASRANNRLGSATVYSGRDGKVLWSWNGAAGNGNYGIWVSQAGDINGDAFGDVVVGASTMTTANGNTGQVIVYSGFDGKVLYTWDGDAAGDLFGASVSDAGDVNNDGRGDIVVGMYGANARSGGVRIFSGMNGSIIRTIVGSTGAGWTVSGAGDINKDGHAEVIVGPGSAASPGTSWIYDGKTGSILNIFQGYQVAGGGDHNGDGTPDTIAGTWLLGGVAWVMSGEELSLRSSTHLIDRTAGGTQNLTIEAGAQHAGRNYWIFGSVTGTKPGINLNGVQIPLNFDIYTQLAMVNVGANPPFSNFRGTLSAGGSASAAFIVPNTLAAPVTVHHAYIVFDGSGAFYMASNAASCRIE